MASWRAFFGAVAIVIVWLGCGTEVTKIGTGSGASGPGSGGNGATGATGASGGGGSISTASGGSGGSECDGLFEAECMAAFPACAPAYDDDCCPACDPGPCADCSNYEFHHCGPRDEICSAGACWFANKLACSGATPDCPPLGGPVSEYVCDQAPGCEVVHCSPEANCVEVECHAVTAGSCSTMCDAVPPSCPPGETAESDGFCYTGFCISAEVCGVF
jgi:hypothetical protein